MDCRTNLIVVVNNPIVVANNPIVVINILLVDGTIAFTKVIVGMKATRTKAIGSLITKRIKLLVVILLRRSFIIATGIARITVGPDLAGPTFCPRGSPCLHRLAHPHSKMVLSCLSSTIFMGPLNIAVIATTAFIVVVPFVSFVMPIVIRCFQPSSVFRTL